MPSYNVNGLMLDPSHPLSRGLVGWWPMGEGAGTRVNDASNNRLTGTLANFAGSQSSGWIGSPVYRGVAFDSVDDSITVAHNVAISNVLTSTAITVSAWVRLDNISNYAIVMYKGTAGGIPGPIQIYWEPSFGGLYYFLIGNGASSNGPQSTTGLAANGVWHHLVCVRSGSTGSFYFNGRNVSGGGGGFGTAGDVGTSLCLGCRTGSYISQGAVSNVRLYNRALSSAEIYNLYSNPWAGALSPARASALTYVPLPSTILSPETSDRLWNHGYSRRIFRRGERITN